MKVRLLFGIALISMNIQNNYSMLPNSLGEYYLEKEYLDEGEQSIVKAIERSDVEKLKAILEKTTVENHLGVFQDTLIAIALKTVKPDIKIIRYLIQYGIVPQTTDLDLINLHIIIERDPGKSAILMKIKTIVEEESS